MSESYPKLIPPLLPQMEDGVIDNRDLCENPSLVIIISPYRNVSPGDYIRIFIDAEFIISKTIISKADLPWVTSHDISGLTDGNYSISYDVRDYAGNFNNSIATIATINKGDSGTLPPPVFSDADGDGFIVNDDIIANSGTHILVQNYNGISVDDLVEVHCIAFDEENAPVSKGHYIENHKVTSDEISHGFSVLVPSVRLLQEGTNHFKAYYIVERPLGENLLSHSATCSLKFQTLTLPPPVFPDAIDGWLTRDQLIDGIICQCGDKTVLSDGQVLKFSWQGLNNLGEPIDDVSDYLIHNITAHDVSTGYVEFTLDNEIAKNITIGSIQAFYMLSQKSGVIYSPISQVSVDFIHQSPIPPPIFIQSVSGILYWSEAVNDNAVVLQIEYPDLAEGQMISLTATGYDSDGKIVPNATYHDEIKTSHSDEIKGSITINLPLSVVGSVGDDGTYLAFYEVRYLEGGMAYSKQGKVVVSMNKQPNNLSIYMSTGAPSHDTSLSLLPKNQGIIKGKPGMIIDVGCDSPAKFENGSQNIRLYLDEQGTADLSISCDIQEGISINAYNEDDPIQQATAEVIFRPYRQAGGEFRAIANTSGAPANGHTPCSVYIVTNANTRKPLRNEITALEARVNGDAVFLANGKNSIEVILSSDKSATLDIINTKAELVDVVISIKENAGSIENVKLAFVNY